MHLFCKECFVIVITTVLFIFFLYTQGCTNKSLYKNNGRNAADMKLNEAWFWYYDGTFDKSIDLISQYIIICKRVKEAPSVQILELLSLNYISKNDYVRAKFWTRVLLFKLPDFVPKPPPKRPAEFVYLVNGLKAQKSRRKLQNTNKK